MALTRKPATAFETMEETQGATAVADHEQEHEATKTVDEATAREATKAALAKAQSRALTTPTKRFSAALQEYQNVIAIDDVKALGVGSFPKIVADRAGMEAVQGSTKRKLGEWIDFQLLSFNDRWVASPGTDGEEATKTLRNSYDNQTIDGETMSLAEYVQYLREQGYEKADVKHYIDAFGFVLASEKEGTLPEDKHELVQLQLSPVSVKAFKALQMSMGVKIAMGKLEASPLLRVASEPRELNGNKFAALTFSAA